MSGSVSKATRTDQKFGCFDRDAEGKDCAESLTGDVFVYGWVFVPSFPTRLFDLAVRNISIVTDV